MPRIVILGSLRFDPYEVLAVPKKEGEHGELWNTEEGYRKASERLYPAIDQADEVWVYVPDGKIGEHTNRDLEYARLKGKVIRILMKKEELLEKLAEIEHKQWAHWTKYFLDNTYPHTSLKDTLESFDKWKKQIETPYSELSEREKESDREWARKVLEVIES